MSVDKMIGMNFGRFKVIEKYDDGKKYSYMYKCECQCEAKTIKIIDKPRLINNKSKDCGCIKEEDIIEDAMKHIGEKYNKLTIIKLFGKRNDVVSGSMFYECKCDCGNDKIIIASLYELNRDRPKSCGKCLGISDETRNKIGEANRGKNTFVEHDDFMEGFCDKGSFIFDKDDFEKIKNVNKYITINNLGYVLFSDKKNGDFQLHRFVMGLGKYNREEDIIVDHIEGNTLDNRKEFLRVCHRNKNPKNATTYKNNTSGHKGVSWLERLNKWQVSIQVDKKNMYLGVYEDFDYAVSIRKEAEIKHFGEYSRDYRMEA